MYITTKFHTCIIAFIFTKPQGHLDPTTVMLFTVPQAGAERSYIKRKEN